MLNVECFGLFAAAIYFLAGSADGKGRRAPLPEIQRMALKEGVRKCIASRYASSDCSKKSNFSICCDSYDLAR
jgi:hypothetical protein